MGEEPPKMAKRFSPFSVFISGRGRIFFPSPSAQNKIRVGNGIVRYFMSARERERECVCVCVCVCVCPWAETMIRPARLLPCHV